MRPSSLARRLFLTAAAITVIVLGLSGVVLSSLYRETAERALDRYLNVYLKNIVVDVATAQAGTIPEPTSLGELSFQTPNSGWYWQIERLSGPTSEMKFSTSLPSPGLPSLDEQRIPIRSDGFREGYVNGPQGQRLRVVENLIDLGADGQYVVTVAANIAETEEEIADFNWTLFITLSLLGIVFVATAWFQVRFGLRPLGRISQSLHAIRTGRAERLEGEFPAEIAPLAREVNALIDTNRDIVMRARTHVGNLAHALKTPLSVLLNETSGKKDATAEKVREQVAVMREQVQHHLERARIAARVAVPGTVVDVDSVIDGVVRTMEKIHRDRAVRITSHVEDELDFHGEEQDLAEMVGNLVDNACKWAKSRVEIRARAEPSAPSADRAFLRVIVDDDGLGLPAGARQEVLTHRGKRLDESKPGSGLGLSIVSDLAHLYQGRLELGASPAGGLRAELVLPAAES
ncbi:MAG: sensor histidine kinase [Bradyrhizobiaceae bacterium]|nr:sensor histidine kinase [Bradyrhizobiaceae bacterium]